MIKLLGTVLVVGSAGGFGLSKGIGFYSQIRTVRSFLAGLEILKCEMNYTLSPLPKLCKTVAGRTSGPCSTFFLDYADLINASLPRTLAARRLLGDEKTYRLPKDARLCLLELFESIGAYELEGENRLLRTASQRLKASLEHLEREKKPLAKSYAVLGLCLGLAVAILFI